VRYLRQCYFRKPPCAHRLAGILLPSGRRAQRYPITAACADTETASHRAATFSLTTHPAVSRNGSRGGPAALLGGRPITDSGQQQSPQCQLSARPDPRQRAWDGVCQQQLPHSCAAHQPRCFARPTCTIHLRRRLLRGATSNALGRQRKHSPPPYDHLPAEPSQGFSQTASLLGCASGRDHPAGLGYLSPPPVPAAARTGSLVATSAASVEGRDPARPQGPAAGDGR
jgi:hypothetical protein